MSYRGRSNKYRGGRGGGQSGQRNQPRGLFADGIWHCDCTPRLPAEHFKVKKEGPNKGRWFYTCQQQDPKRCGFFLWDEDAKVREEGAVLGNSRSEARAEGVQESWNAGRGRDGGKGLSANHGQQRVKDEDESTASPSPPPSYTTNPPKRTAQDADLNKGEEGYGWGLDDLDDEVVAWMGDHTNPETPRKAQRTGVYATPATTGKRKLPWLEPPTTPAVAKEADEYFATPSKAPSSGSTIRADPETPFAPPTLATASSPSPPTRHKDALHNPADIPNSLTSEVMAVLSSTPVPPDALSEVRSILTRHDLKTQGVMKGRDISRLALKAKDAKIAELQARIASLEAEREVEREVSRMGRRRNG